MTRRNVYLIRELDTPTLVKTVVSTMPQRTIAERIMLGAFGVFCFVYPFAMFLLSFDLMPFGMEWMSSLLLAILGVAAGSWLWVNFGVRGALLGTAIFAAGVALEYVGVLTGAPFGAYRYTGVLAPELPGGVPLAIGFAWLMIVVGGLYTARLLIGVGSGRGEARPWLGWVACLLGAALAVGLDFLLEPVAYHVKHYWEWQGIAEGYYGVPWSNFITWFAAALLMNGAVTLTLNRGQPLGWKWLPPALYVMNVVLFGVVNIAHGFWMSGAIGLLLLGVLCLPWVLRRFWHG